MTERPYEFQAGECTSEGPSPCPGEFPYYGRGEGAWHLRPTDHNLRCVLWCASISTSDYCYELLVQGQREVKPTNIKNFQSLEGCEG